MLAVAILSALIISLLIWYFRSSGVLSGNHKILDDQIIQAILQDDHAQLKSFISMGFPVNKILINGSSPLLIAAESGSIESTKLLLDNGAYVNFKTQSGMTALMIASKKGDIDLVRLLIKYGANVKTVSKNSWTPVKLAEKYGHSLIVEYLSSRDKYAV